MPGFVLPLTFRVGPLLGAAHVVHGATLRPPLLEAIFARLCVFS